MTVIECGPLANGIHGNTDRKKITRNPPLKQAPQISSNAKTSFCPLQSQQRGVEHLLKHTPAHGTYDTVVVSLLFLTSTCPSLLPCLVSTQPSDPLLSVCMQHVCMCVLICARVRGYKCPCATLDVLITLRLTSVRRALTVPETCLFS